MQWILSVFAIRFNKFCGQKGHVWYDRFKSIIIRSFHQLIIAFQYISNNPVKAGLCSDAADYRYSGLYELKRKQLRVLNSPDRILA